MSEEPKVFDVHARQYSDTIQRAIGASGEQHDYFVQLKADFTVAALADLRPSSILDFGCGIGLSTRALARNYPGVSLVGCDDSLESLSLAADAMPQLRFVHTPEPVLPFADASFDIAFAACVFHHIPREQRSQAAAELARVVRPGGAVIIFEHNPRNPLTVRVVRRIPFDEGVSLLPAEEVTTLLHRSGLQVLPPSYYFFFPRFLAALRPLERWLTRVPLGAQYYSLGRRPRERPR